MPLPLRLVCTRRIPDTPPLHHFCLANMMRFSVQAINAKTTVKNSPQPNSPLREKALCLCPHQATIPYRALTAAVFPSLSRGEEAQLVRNSSSSSSSRTAGAAAGQPPLLNTRMMPSRENMFHCCREYIGGVILILDFELSLYSRP